MTTHSMGEKHIFLKLNMAEYYQTPVIEASSTGVSKNPAINIAHFRCSEVHWPRLAFTLSFNSVRERNTFNASYR